MKPSCVCGVLAAALIVAAPRAHAQETFIEYTVTGSATASGRDADAVMCSVTEDGLLVRSLGDWVFDFETSSADPGERAARVRVAAPAAVAALHDDDARTDDRLSGEGTVVVESAGTGSMNLPLIRIRFSAKGLSSDTGASIDVSGTFACLVM